MRSLWTFLHKPNFCYLIAIILLVQCKGLFAAYIEQKVKQLPHQSLYQHEFINHINPLDNGFLLFASQSGVRLFDGYEFIPLVSENQFSTSVLNTATDATLKDSNGNYWLATSLGLYRFNVRSGELINMNDELFGMDDTRNIVVKEIYEDSTGRLWFGLLNGVAIHNPNTGFTEVLTQVNENKKNIGRIFTIIEESQNKIWLGSNTGLYFADVKNSQWTVQQVLESEYITSSTRFNNFEIWFGSDHSGIYRLHLSSGKLTNLRDNPLKDISLASPHVWGLYLDSRGLLWVSYWDAGISIFDINHQRQFRLQHRAKDSAALPGQSVEHITEDKFGNIWIATTEGAAFFAPEWLKFQYLRTPVDSHNISSIAYINHIYEDAEGRVWIATEQGLELWIPATGLKKTYAIPHDKNIIDKNTWKITSIDDKRLVLASSSGAWLFNYHDESFTRLKSTSKNIHDTNQLAFYSLAGNSSSQLYLANSTSDIFIVDPVNDESRLLFEARKHPLSVHVEYFTRMYYDTSGNLWMASPTGVFWLRPESGELKHLNATRGTPKLNSNIIHDILEDPDGNIWLATASGGLNKIKTNERNTEITTVNMSNGLPENEILNLIPGNQNYFWFTTQTQVGKYYYQSGEVKLYPQLSNPELGFSANCWSKSVTGYINLCGNEVIRFHPDELLPFNQASTPVLTSLYRLHKRDPNFSPLLPTVKTIFNPDDYLITFKFSALEYAYTDFIQYQYQLKGHDKTWYSPGAANMATYTHLPHGDFKLLVKSTVDGENWSEPVNVIDFTVLPPWWKTQLAYLLYFVSTLLVIGLFYFDRREKRRKERAALEAITQSEERLRDVLWGSGDQLWRWDLTNNQMFRTEKITLHELPRESIYDWDDIFARIHAEDRALVSDLIQQHLAGDTEYYEAQFRLMSDHGNTWEWVLMKGRVVERDKHKKPTMLAGTLKNIDDLKQTEEQLRYLANYDQLTELPNRSMFLQQMTHAIQLAKRFNEKVALLFFDLDGFKIINDSLGHAIGDQLLKAVAQRLTLILRESDHVARLGGDEFTVIIERIHSPDDIVPTLKRINHELNQPFDLGTQTVMTAASIGVALYPEHGANAETLLKHADIAMYEAKRSDQMDYCFFEEQMNALLVRRLDIEKQLEQAITNDEFVTFFQPRVRVSDNTVNGYEALIRWNHPDKGLVSPAEFIPVAEETGQIIYLGSWVLFDACKQCAKWHAKGHKTTVSVNIAALQFQQSDLTKVVRQALDASKLQPEYLELEITEGTLIQNLEHTRRVLYELKQLGIKIALDDFGTGYSSLSYLQQFPIDILKIDRSFIIQLSQSKKSAMLCQAIINMAHSLDLEVVAEGIETEEQLQFLVDSECEEYQGYLYGKPIPASEITF